MTIEEKIKKHLYAYENYGDGIPPFRITCKEHKELFDYLWPSFFLTDLKNQKSRRIAEYIGVQLELVTSVEDYC